MFSVRTGDKIPCDSIVTEGQSTVDESSLTGESRPVKNKINDKVSGGSMNNGSSQLLVKVTATVDNSAIARLIRHSIMMERKMFGPMGFNMKYHFSIHPLKMKKDLVF